MGASTAFFGVIRGIRSSLQNIIAIDTELTVLRRVMDGTTDFNAMLKEGISISTDLGKNLRDTMESMTGFARQGYDEAQIAHLTRTAQLMTNISELEAEEAMSTMTAAMTIFNIEASRSIEIVDKLNEIDNNYALTTVQLSNALMKAGSTAVAFNVTLEEMLGHTTAIAVATRESGEVVGNSLKTIYSRLTTMQPSIDALANLGINIKDSTGEIKSASQIIDELAGKWDTLTAAEQQNIGVKLAGRFQLSRFLVLMQNHQMALDATTTALNSEGSAMRENSKFMESLEARINLLNTAWQELTLSMGDAFLTDTFIGILNLLTSLANGVGGLIDQIGLLPVVLGAATVGFIAFSGRARRGIASLGSSIQWTNTLIDQAAFKTQLWSTRLLGAGRATNILTLSVRGLGVALRAALVTSGIGIAIAGVGFAIEKLVTYFSNASAEAKRLREETEKSTQSWSNQRDRVEELVSSIQKLNDVQNRTNEQQEEFIHLQNELATLMPTLTAFVDENGIAHTFVGEQLENQIRLTKELIDLEKERTVIESTDNLKEMRKNRDKTISQIEEIQEKLDKGFTEASGRGDVYRAYYTDSQINEFETELRRLQISLSNIEKDIQDSVLGISNTILELSNIDNKEVTDSLIAIFETVEDGASIDTAKVSKDFLELIEQAEKLSKIPAPSDPVSAQVRGKELEEYRKVLNRLKSDFPDAINLIDDFSSSLMNSYKEAEEFATSGQQVFEVYDEGGKLIDSFVGTLDEFVEAYKIIDTLLDEEGGFKGYQAILRGSLEELKYLDEATKEYTSSVNTLGSAYKTLSDGQDLSLDTVLKLIAEFPELARHMAYTNDLKFKEGQLIKQVAQWRREDLIQEKRDALNSMQIMQHQLQARMALDEYYRATIGTSIVSEEDAERYREQGKAIANLRAELNALENFDFSKAFTSSSSSTSTPFSYVTDEYAKAISALDLLITQSAGRQSKYTEESAEYRKELNLQIKHMKEKQSLMKTEADRLRDITDGLRKQRSALNPASEAYQRLTQEIDNNEKAIEGLSSAWWGVENSIDSARKSLESMSDTLKKQSEDWGKNVESTARDAISIIEDYYREQERIAKDALDKDLSNFNKFIDDYLKAMDRLDDTEDYEAELKRKQQEQLRIESDIQKISRDNSLEGQARRRDLEEELARQIDDIQKFQTDRERKLRRDNFEDMKDTKERHIKEEKDKVEETWKNALNADEYYLSLRQDLLDGNVMGMQNTLEMFSNNVANYMIAVGDSIQQNTIDKVIAAKNEIEKISNFQASVRSNVVSEEQRVIGQMVANSARWHTHPEERTELHLKNIELGDRIGATYKAGRWYKNNIPLYHDGGLVESKSRIGTILDGILNRNEVPAILKQGELVVKDPLSAMKNIVRNFTMPQLNPATSGGTVNHYSLTLEIETFSGTPRESQEVFSRMNRELNKMGKK